MDAVHFKREGLLALLSVLFLSFATMAILASCGDTLVKGPGPNFASLPASSAPVLTAPPSVNFSAMVGPCQFSAGSAGNKIRFTPLEGVPSEISVPGSQVLLCRAYRHGGIDYLLVGTIDVAEVFTLYRFHDTGGDSAPDLASQSQILTTSPYRAYVTEITMSGSRWFFLDRRCQDIWRAQAQGGFPTTLHPTPFARSATESELLGIAYIRADSASQVRGSSVFPLRERVATSREFEVVVFEDTDGDAVSDSTTIEGGELVPVTNGVPYEGQSSIQVFVNNEPGTYEVWSLDSSGDEDELLGSEASVLDNWTAIPLSPALGLGSRIRVRVQGKAGRSDYTVVASNPQVVRSEPDDLPVLSATTFTIYGLNLTSTMTVWLRPMASSENPVSLSFTLGSSEDASVTLPILPATLAGKMAELYAVESGQSGEPVQSTLVNIVSP